MTRSQETRPSFRRGGIVCPAGVGGIAHEMNFRFGASQLAADQRVAPRRAGPTVNPPLRSAALFGRVSPRPTLAVALSHGGGGHFFQFSRNHELAGQDARDATDTSPCLLGLLALHANHFGGEAWAKSGISSSEIRKVT